MRLFLLIVIGAALAFLVIWFGWLGVAGLSIGVCLLCWLFPGLFSERMRYHRNFFFFLALFFAVGFLSALLIWEWLTLHQEALMAYPVRSFLFGTDLRKFYWATIGFFAIPILFSALILLPYGAIAARNSYSTYAGYKGHEWAAALNSVRSALGISRGTWSVIDGKIEAEGSNKRDIGYLGGPANLIVQEGHVVILERSGKRSRVVGSGLTWLKGRERVSMVVPLTPRSERIVMQNVPTKDMRLIEEFAFVLFYKVDPGPGPGRIKDGAFEYTRQIILDRVWSPVGSDSSGAVRSIGETTARDVVGQYDLDQLLPLSDKRRTDLRKKLADDIDAVLRKLGFTVNVVDITNMKLPEEAEQRLLQKWLALADQEILMTRADTDQEVQKRLAAARQESMAKVGAGLFEMLKVNSGVKPSIRDIIALRFIEYLELHAGATNGDSGGEGTSALLKLQGLEALTHLRDAG